IAKTLLSTFNIKIFSLVLSIGGISLDDDFLYSGYTDFNHISEMAEKSILRCPNESLTNKFKELIDLASSEGDTLGGTFAVIVEGLPVGLGNFINWDLRLDARLSYAMMGIQAIKAVEIGKGIKLAHSKGSEVMDEIYYQKDKLFYRKTNNAGGVEGGMTNGMPLVIKCAMKPIPTLKKPLTSVDIKTKETVKAVYERSDVCAVPSASVIAEAMSALVIADAFLEKFSGDSINETMNNYNSYLRAIVSDIE
ncbi:MAG TPA: chorismate synthase, partial [Nitrospirae bacterium]|nr:chorismate synthase [Nitrospirota bacterium]